MSDELTFADIAEELAFDKRNGIPLRTIKMTELERMHLIAHSTFNDRLHYMLVINHDGTCTETIYGLPIEIVQSTGQMDMFPENGQKLLPATNRTPEEKYRNELNEYRRKRDNNHD